MPRLLICTAITMLLAACAEGEAPALFYSAAERDADRCIANGLEPGSEAHNRCLQRAAYYRQAQRDYRGLAGPSVRCTAGSNAGGCF